MSWLQTVTPTNLWIEKEKFFADSTYNPQFEYTSEISNTLMNKYGIPNQRYLDLAQEIVDRAFYGRNEQDLQMMQGRTVSHTEVEAKFQLFLKMHHLEDRFPVIWSETAISRATVDQNITLRNNATFREKDLIGLIYHEVGTHALRRVNYENQPWYKKKKDYGFNTSYLSTEEGLASLHSLLPLSYKSAYGVALRYLANDYARHHSLVETWNYLTRYISDLETRWMVCSRQKRGIMDTSKPGAFSKDIVYFEGFIDIWKWLSNNDYDPTKLYFGKCSWKDTEKAIKLNPEYQPILPSFFILSPESYKEHIIKVGTENLLDKI